MILDLSEQQVQNLLTFLQPEIQRSSSLHEILGALQSATVKHAAERAEAANLAAANRAAEAKAAASAVVPEADDFGLPLPEALQDDVPEAMPVEPLRQGETFAAKRRA